MFIKSIFGEKEDVKEEEVVLFSDGFEDDVCCFCDKVIKLEEKEVFCIGCPNICHHTCLKKNTLSVFEPVGKIKTFRCPKCAKIKLQAGDECGQTNVALPTLDKRYENKREERGPNKDRRCTDVIGIVLFCLTVGVFVLLTLCLGGLSSVGNGTDSCGNVCGQVNKYPPESLREKHGCMGADHSDKKFVMFVDYIIQLSDINTSPRECVSACPKNMVQILSYCLHFGTPDEPTSLESKLDQHMSSSSEDSYENSLNMESELPKEEVLKMKGWVNGNWDTIPTHKIHVFGEVMKHLFQLRAMKWFTFVNLFKVWTLAIVMSYIIVVIFCCFPHTAVWIVPLTMMVTFIMACAYITMLILDGVINVFSCIMGFMLLSILFLNLLKLQGGHWKIIKKQVKLMGVFYREAGRLLSYVPGVLLLSILTMILSFSTVIVWFRVAFWIESSNVIYSPFNHSGATIQTTARWLWIFLSIWVLELTINIQKMIVAGSAAHWYFAKNKKNFSYVPVIKSIWVTFRCHLGTLLLGSIMFYPLTFLRCLVKIMVRRDKTLKDLKKLKILFTEFWLKFVPDILVFWYNISSSFTFYLIALRGKGFCESERKLLDLFINHFLHAANVIKYSAIFPAMTKIYVTILTTLASIYLFDWTDGLGCRTSENLNFALVIGIIVVLSTVTAQYFLTSFQMVVDAIFVCYCEDIDSRNEIKAELIKALSKENCSQMLLSEDDMTSVKTESPPLIPSKKLTSTSQIESKKTPVKEIKV